MTIEKFGDKEIIVNDDYVIVYHLDRNSGNMLMLEHSTDEGITTVENLISGEEIVEVFQTVVHFLQTILNISEDTTEEDLIGIFYGEKVKEEEGYTVYRIYNTVSDKYYFGYTNSEDKEDFLYDAVDKNRHFANSVNKYGKGFFEVIVMDENDTAEECEKAVEYYTDHYKNTLHRTVYNY